jgi:hypothetical protein
MNRLWPATIVARELLLSIAGLYAAAHRPMAYESGLPRSVI